LVVDHSNGLDAAHVDSAEAEGVGISSVILVGDFSNALDLCDSVA
jgi:hypothetical protein